MTTTSSSRTGWNRSLLFWLLMFLIFTVAVVPTVEYFRDARWLINLGLTGVLMTAAALTWRSGRRLGIATIVAIVILLLSWTTVVVDSPWLFLSSTVLEALFLIAMAVFILATVLRQHLATIDSIFGAIAAYLLIGFAFALVYWGIAAAVPESLRTGGMLGEFMIAEEETMLIREYAFFIYFSFVTMSTLGYGDISPQTPIAQTLAWMQAVIGQFYIAVLVAWLVSEISARGRD